DPFFTIATQNPIEQEGTYPLPEAQLDRFMFNIKVDYPTLEEEEQILSVTTRSEKPEVRKILSGKAIVNLQKLVGSVAVSEHRISCNFQAQAEGMTNEDVIKKLLALIPEPEVPKFTR